MTEFEKENAHISSGEEDSSEELQRRKEILNQIEAGEIDVSEGLKLLERNEKPDGDDVLNRLESGEINVDEAIRRIEQSEEHQISQESSPVPNSISQDDDLPSTWKSWWYVLFGFGLASVAAGGWLGTVGGWWWLCAAPSLFFGLLITTLAIASFNSPWLHVRIDTGHDSWPRRIAFGLPIPFRFASWFLRVWGPKMEGLDHTAIDELILALEGNLSADNPIFIDVHEEDDSGERIRVYLG
jgi:hypothetical protein